jgi:hypothetical protein
MKSINFQRNKSLIRVVNDDKIKKERNWDRIIYLLLLSLFTIFLCYYLFYKISFVNGLGQVIIDKNEIRLTDDARIIEFYINEGDSVKKNDTLFSYALDLDEENSLNLPISESNKTSEIKVTENWGSKELFTLKKKISINSIDINENNFLIANYKSEIKRLSNEVILDVLPKNKLEFVQNEIIQLNSKNLKLQKENDELSKLITNIEANPQKSVNSELNTLYNNSENSNNYNTEKLSFSDELLTKPKYFRSPVDGIVTKIFIENYETALKTEEIMSIHKSRAEFIKAYFEQEDLKHIKVGDIFNIEFPDGTASKGMLKRFYITTYTLPEEFQKKYESTTRSLAADIYPLDSTELIKWKLFYKMSVKISKNKFK